MADINVMHIVAATLFNEISSSIRSEKKYQLKTKFSAQRRFICPSGMEGRDKGQTG